MEELIKLTALCVVATILVGVLRQYAPGYAVLTALACCMLLLGYTVRAAQPLLEFVRTLAQAGMASDLACVAKAVAITLMAQCIRDLCVEAGQPALAGRVELAGKAAVLLAALPLFTKLTDILTGLLV